MPRKRSKLQRQKGTDLALPDAAGALAPTRDRLLALAGFDAERQADILRRAVEAELSALAATKVDRVAWQGVVTATFEDVDHQTRLRASEQLKVLLGANASRSQASGPSAVQVNILVKERAPEPAQVEVVDVTPKSV